VTRADLEDSVLANVAERVCDGMPRGIVHQKVLSEFGLPHERSGLSAKARLGRAFVEARV
jgi:hypothetical protein